MKTKPVEILEIFTFYFTQSSYNLKETVEIFLKNKDDAYQRKYIYT